MSLETRITELAQAVGADIKALTPESNPVFTYDGTGALTRVDYASGNYKLFTYTGSALTQLDHVIGASTVRKVFAYNPDGSLASVTRTVI